MTESDIAMLCSEGIAFNDNNNLDPENVMQSDDVLPIPLSLTFGFHSINPWRQSGNFPFERSKLKIAPHPRIQHISRLNFSMKLYFVYYINDVVIPEKKNLHSDMNFGEYFCAIGCRLIMACYVGHSLRDLFLKDTITPRKAHQTVSTKSSLGGALRRSIRLCFQKNIAVPDFNYYFFQKSKMQ